MPAIEFKAQAPVVALKKRNRPHTVRGRSPVETAKEQIKKDLAAAVERIKNQQAEQLSRILRGESPDVS